MSLALILVITGICLIPFCSAFFYFVIGIRSYFIGKRESNKAKIIGGYNTVAYSILAMGVVAFIWFIAVKGLFGWD